MIATLVLRATARPVCEALLVHLDLAGQADLDRWVTHYNLER